MPGVACVPDACVEALAPVPQSPVGAAVSVDLNPLPGVEGHGGGGALAGNAVGGGGANDGEAASRGSYASAHGTGPARRVPGAVPAAYRTRQSGLTSDTISHAVMLAGSEVP